MMVNKHQIFMLKYKNPYPNKTGQISLHVT